MRPDFKKVVTERPRSGGGVKTPKGDKRQWQRYDVEDYPKREKLRAKWDRCGSKHFTDAKSLHAACKDGTFNAFVHAASPLHVKSDAPGVAVIGNDTVAWHFTLAGGAWRLVTMSEAR